MHKSIIIYLGLLTFLIPVAPSISNSNALAFSDYGYQADQYENYAMDMANQNYYKSNNDLIKKIKCNNINSNFNGVEANIGNDDSLGSIGAESLEADDASANWLGNGERNNNNFDLDCINNNNNEGGQGQVGPQGPTGPQGSTGPPGITQLIYGTNVYLVQDIDDRDDSSVLQGFARCDPGDFVINGGYTLGGTIGANTIVTTDRPFTENSPLPLPEGRTIGEGWETTVGFIPPGPFNQLNVYAFCFDNPPLRP